MESFVNYTYWKWDNVLSPKFCNFALSQINWDESKASTLEADLNVPALPEVRVTDILFESQMEYFGCIASKYIDIANKSAGWNFELTGQEDTQVARYRAENNGHYTWHIDTTPPKNGIQRKISCVILLNDPSEFEGGELQFKEMEDTTVFKKQGSIIVFPSFIEHRVTPVTKGVRYTAVAWADGPSFR